jgi:predicted alpha/beta-fold hydrolase
MKLKAMKELSSLLKRIDLKKASGQELPFDFKPTTFMSHHILQTMYDLAEPRMKFQLTREKVFFEDGGHISLDWSSQQQQKKDPPILFLMHGLTGGSEMNYIRVMMNEAVQRGYQGVCLNSRGINNEMTSPVPFTGLSFHELDSALDRVELHYPRSKIFMVGASFGGNYLLRYVLRQQRPSVKGLVTLASPLSVKRVVSDMPYQYQKFFVRRYIHQTVTKHP